MTGKSAEKHYNMLINCIELELTPQSSLGGYQKATDFGLVKIVEFIYSRNKCQIPSSTSTSFSGIGCSSLQEIRPASAEFSNQSAND